jgi:hypothetical protein
MTRVYQLFASTSFYAFFILITNNIIISRRIRYHLIASFILADNII